MTIKKTDLDLLSARDYYIKSLRLNNLLINCKFFNKNNCNWPSYNKAIKYKKCDFKDYKLLKYKAKKKKKS